MARSGAASHHCRPSRRPAWQRRQRGRRQVGAAALAPVAGAHLHCDRCLEVSRGESWPPRRESLTLPPSLTLAALGCVCHVQNMLQNSGRSQMIAASGECLLQMPRALRPRCPWCRLGGACSGHQRRMVKLLLISECLHASPARPHRGEGLVPSPILSISAVAYRDGHSA